MLPLQRGQGRYYVPCLQNNKKHHKKTRRLPLWKAPARIFSVESEDLRLGKFEGLDVDELASVASGGEFHGSAHECEQSVVLADAYVEAGMVHGAALTLEDVACFGKLAAKNLDAQTFAF